MPLRTRVIIALVFIAVFLVVAPPLVWFSSGYLYDWNRHEWFRPGWIVLDSQPPKAEIFLNGRDTGQKTPATIKDLRPDDYAVELQSPSYHSWSKKLTVSAGVAIFAENIRLFKISLPEVKLSGNDNFFSSPNSARLAILSSTKNGLTVLDSESKTLQTIDTKSPVSGITWDATGDNALIQLTDGSSDIYKNGQTDLRTVNLPVLKNWQLIADKNQIWGMSDNKIFQIDINTGVSTQMASFTGLQNFRKIGDKLYAVVDSASGNSTYLDLVKENGQLQIITRLPKSRYIFIDGSQLITLKDEINNQLYVIQPTTEATSILPELIASAQGAQWDAKGEKILFFTPSEIWVWDSQQNTKTLLNRLSEKIDLATWYPTGDYVFFATDTEVKAIELDDRDYRQIISLTQIPVNNKKTTGLDALAVSRDGKKMYLVFPGNNQLDLAEQDLQ